MRAVRRQIHPTLRDRALQARGKYALATLTGWRSYIDFFRVMHGEVDVLDTPMMRERLRRLAVAVGVPQNEIFQ